MVMHEATYQGLYDELEKIALSGTTRRLIAGGLGGAAAGSVAGMSASEMGEEGPGTLKGALIGAGLGAGALAGGGKLLEGRALKKTLRNARSFARREAKRAKPYFGKESPEEASARIKHVVSKLRPAYEKAKGKIKSDIVPMTRGFHITDRL